MKGVRIGVGRSYPAGKEYPNTGPWVGTSDGIVVNLGNMMSAEDVLEWFKLHFPEALLITVAEDDGTVYQWRFKGTSGRAQKTSLAKFLDDITRITFGRSREESIDKKVCVMCGGLAAGTFGPGTSLDEYLVSGLCGLCQLRIFGPTPEKT